MIPDTLTWLVKDFGFEHANSVLTPATPDLVEEEESEPLCQDRHQQYRSQFARCLFLCQDRADITFIVNELMPEDVETQSPESCQIEKGSPGI